LKDHDIDEIDGHVNKKDDMNVIKAYIGNILYEKWFLENFTKNTEQIDKLPPSKIKYLKEIYESDEEYAPALGVLHEEGQHDDGNSSDDNSFMEMLTSPEKKSLQSKKNFFAKNFLRPMGSSIKSMETRMRVLPQNSLIRNKVEKPIKGMIYTDPSETISYIENKDLKSASDDEESTTIGYEYLEMPSYMQIQNDAIDSQAFKNSVFHPEYKRKISKENESKKTMQEVDKVYEGISKNFASKISEEWADLIFKMRSKSIANSN